MALPQDGQNANGLTKVTEIPKGKELIFIDPTTNEGGIITLEDLTTQILKNLTSQTFALDQGNMTLLAALNQLNSNSLTHAERITINPSDGKSIILDDESSYLICYATINAANIVDMGFAVALSRMSEEKTGGILSVNPELSGTNFTLDGNTLKVSTNTWIVMTLTKI